MDQEIPRLRVFAGPNGSGKSRLKTVIRPEWLGVYINPDEIERCLRTKQGLDISTLHLSLSPGDLIKRLQKSPFLQPDRRRQALSTLKIKGSRLIQTEEHEASYVAAALADIAREDLIENKQSLTFETVMSHPSKLEILDKARNHGFQTYLYYIATNDPEINVARVKQRVAEGGHDVPEDKIRSRYTKSLENLAAAIQLCNRAYIFDNSDGDSRPQNWLAEFKPDGSYEYKTENMPEWFLTHVDAYLKR